MLCLLVGFELVIDLKFTSWKCLRSTTDFSAKHNDVTIVDNHR